MKKQQVKEKIKMDLQELKKKEDSGVTIVLYLDHKTLYDRMIRVYGSILTALKDADLIDKVNFGVKKSVPKRKYKWNRDKIIYELQELYELKGSEPFSLRKEFPQLRDACYDHFEDVDDALEHAGLKGKLNPWISNRKNNRPENHDNTKVTRDIIMKRLKRLFKKYPLGYEGMFRKDYRNLWASSIELFGSIDQAIEQAGGPEDWHSKYWLYYVDRSNVDDPTRLAGIYAERYVVDKLLNELGICYDKEFSDHLRPDYIFYENLWGDVKLNYYDESKNNWNKSILKYQEKALLFIYIFGPDYGFHEVVEGVRAVHINYFINQLSSERKNYYLKKIKDINDFVSKNNYIINYLA